MLIAALVVVALYIVANKSTREDYKYRYGNPTPSPMGGVSKDSNGVYRENPGVPLNKPSTNQGSGSDGTLQDIKSAVGIGTAAVGVAGTIGGALGIGGAATGGTAAAVAATTAAAATTEVASTAVGSAAVVAADGAGVGAGAAAGGAVVSVAAVAIPVATVGLMVGIIIEDILSDPRVAKWQAEQHANYDFIPEIVVLECPYNHNKYSFGGYNGPPPIDVDTGQQMQDGKLVQVVPGSPSVTGIAKETPYDSSGANVRIINKY